MFRMVNRSRKYLSGVAGVIPLPLSVPDITEAVSAYGSPLNRRELDMCIFALDKEWVDSLE